MPNPSEGEGTGTPPSGQPAEGRLRAIPRLTWLAAAIAAIALSAIVAVLVGLWAAFGNSDISVAGWAAMIFGALLTLGLGVGLMSLVFFSNRRGYDDL
jgi:hypothetical protein